jgi:hypothetical protein
MASPRASSHGKVDVVPELRAGEGTSLSLGAVVADTGHPLRLPWADLCRLDVLGGLVSP